MNEKSKGPITYELNDKPPLKHLLPLSIQHVLLFLASTIAVPLIIGSAIGFEAGDISILVQCGIFVAGVGTMVQAFGIGPVGNRLPIILGQTFTFVTPCIAISLAYGFDAFVGASLICGLLIAIFGAFCIKFIKKIFPPIVMGCVIMVIGLALVNVAVDYCAGGSGAPDYGSWQNYLLAAITLIIVILFNTFGKGFIKGASVLLAMVIGFIIAMCMGMVDFGAVSEAAVFSLPKPLHFGISFKLAPIIIVGILYLVNTVEFIGDTSTVALVAANREVKEEELSRGIVCDGLASAFAAIFNVIPNVSYSGNIGLIGLTGVKSRYIVGTAGILITALGFIPKLSTLLSLIPSPVIGGATLVIFGIIATSGLTILMRAKPTERDKLIIAVSLAIGLGFNFTPGALDRFPYFVSTLVNGIPGTAFTGIILNLILPQDKAKTAEE